MDEGTAKGRPEAAGGEAVTASEAQPDATQTGEAQADGTAAGTQPDGTKAGTPPDGTKAGGWWPGGPQAGAPVVVPVERRPEAVLGTFLASVTFLGVVAILLGLLVWRGGTGFGPTTVTGPLAGRQNATFQLDDGVGAVRMRAAPLGDDLYRITVPAGYGISPRVDRDGGDVRLSLESTGRGGPGLIDVALNARVAWTLRVNGGTRQTVVDMGAGRLDGIELAGGSSHVEVTLPPPLRVVTVRLTSGVDQFVVRLPAGTPVRVTLTSGAGRVTLDGSSRQGVSAGQSFTANGFGTTNTGVDIQAGAGVGSLDVAQY